MQQQKSLNDVINTIFEFASMSVCPKCDCIRLKIDSNIRHDLLDLEIFEKSTFMNPNPQHILKTIFVQSVD